MAECSICGEKIPDGGRTCSLCGSSADEFLPTGTMLGTLAPLPAVVLPIELPHGGSYCPVCARVYGPEHNDAFCSCGTELKREFRVEPITEEVPTAPILDDIPMAPILEDIPMAPILDDTTVPMQIIAKPAPGTPCVVLYGPDKQPMQYFALVKDATLIGRLDAVAGNFPDVDMDEWCDRTVIRRVSRQHAVILRTRATGGFVLRPLAGNTGTQLETQMLVAQQDYPLRPGHRIILGGVVRLKFEIA